MYIQLEWIMNAWAIELAFNTLFEHRKSKQWTNPSKIPALICIQLAIWKNLNEKIKWNEDEYEALDKECQVKLLEMDNEKECQSFWNVLF